MVPHKIGYSTKSPQSYPDWKSLTHSCLYIVDLYVCSINLTSLSGRLLGYVVYSSVRIGRPYG